jgi:hypothetical protein
MCLDVQSHFITNMCLHPAFFESTRQS